jgi:hypothetical protein
VASGFQEDLRDFCANGFEPYPLQEMAKGIVSKFGQVTAGSTELLDKAHRLKQYVKLFHPVATAFDAAAAATGLVSTSSSAPSTHEKQHDPLLAVAPTDPIAYYDAAWENNLPKITFFLMFSGDYKFAREACSLTFLLFH